MIRMLDDALEIFFEQILRQPRPTLFPYTTLFRSPARPRRRPPAAPPARRRPDSAPSSGSRRRSEEHTSELQSHVNLVCRLLLEKKKKNTMYISDKVYVFNLTRLLAGCQCIPRAAQ